MKKHLLFLGLATACTRASEPTERPRPFSSEHNTLVSDSTQRVLSADSASQGPTPEQRQDYRRQMELLRHSTADEPSGKGRDSAFLVITLPDRGSFVRRVNQCLEGGYFLRGPLRTERTGPGSFVYVQDLVCHRAHVRE